MSTAALVTRDLMTRDLVTLRPGDSLARAEREMRLNRVRHLPVVDERGVLVGLLSQRDLLAAGNPLSGKIADHMRSDLKCVKPDSPAHEAAYLLLRHRIGCVPVVDPDERLVGLVTDTDFLRVAYVVTGGLVPVDQLEAEEREADQV